MAESQQKKPKTTKRAAQRPRMDAVVRHIMAGSYDDELPILKGAIDARNQKRQEAVMGLVQQVFGEDHIVIPKSQRPNPFIERAKSGLNEHEVLPGQSPHVLDPSAQLGGDPDEDKLLNDPDYESHSPVIGSVDLPSGPAQAEEPAAEPEAPQPD